MSFNNYARDSNFVLADKDKDKLHNQEEFLDFIIKMQDWLNDNYGREPLAYPDEVRNVCWEQIEGLTEEVDGISLYDYERIGVIIRVLAKEMKIIA